LIFFLCLPLCEECKEADGQISGRVPTSCEESKECKETDKQILEEGCRCRMRKSKECKETDRQIPEEACHHRWKERNEVHGIGTASEE
jgi:hypothetical protein